MSIFKHGVRPLFIARIQLREAIRSLRPSRVGDRMETIVNCSRLTFFPWLNFTQEYLCLTRVESSGKRVELYMKPDAELHVMMMQDSVADTINTYQRK